MFSRIFFLMRVYPPKTMEKKTYSIWVNRKVDRYGQCLLSQRAFGDQAKDNFIIMLVHHLDMTSNETIFQFQW